MARRQQDRECLDRRASLPLLQSLLPAIKLRRCQRADGPEIRDIRFAVIEPPIRSEYDLRRRRNAQGRDLCHIQPVNQPFAKTELVVEVRFELGGERPVPFDAVSAPDVTQASCFPPGRSVRRARRTHAQDRQTDRDDETGDQGDVGESSARETGGDELAIDLGWSGCGLARRREPWPHSIRC